MNAVLEGFKSLGPARLIAMGGVALGVLGLLALLALHGGGQPMALLYGNLGLRDSADVVDALQKSHIPYKLAAQGTEILVPADQVDASRLLLAKSGLPTGGSIGYAIFDKANALTMNSFQQHIDETRALDGELERTIGLIHGVRGARVQIVLPRREPFARTARPAQASVLLTMGGVARLDSGGVQAILNLIAAAVPGLRPENIAIVDNRGDLLARAGQPTGANGAAMTDSEIRRATELRLARAVESMLGRTLGPDHVRAEATVQMNFDRIHEVQQNFDPNGQVARSEQSVTDTSTHSNPAKSVSVQNNLPNAAAGSTTAGSRHKHQERTTNYEISKTVRTLVHAEPQITRISLAVMVDGTRVPGPGGKTVWKPRSARQLAQIAALVKSAIGYDAKRGDQVEVASMRFRNAGLAPQAAPKGLFGLALGKADLMRLAETGMLGMIALLALLLVLRPMVLRLTMAPPTALAATDGPAALPPAAGGMLPAPDQQPASAAAIGLLADESMVNIAHIEGQLRASSIRRIAELADKHPDETLSIVRNWIAQEAG